MSESIDRGRRCALKQLAIGVAAVSLVGRAIPGRADEAFLSENDPAAKEVHYVEDVKRATNAKPNQTCGNCSVFDGANGATQGHCALFNGKLVKAAGWCSAWTNM